MLESLIKLIQNAGGKPFFVGGYPRDLIMGATTTPKDVDIEVFGVSYDTIKEALVNAEYKADLVGQSFGVLKTREGDIEVDISLPRTEKKVG